MINEDEERELEFEYELETPEVIEVESVEDKPNGLIQRIPRKYLISGITILISIGLLAIFISSTSSN